MNNSCACAFLCGFFFANRLHEHAFLSPSFSLLLFLLALSTVAALSFIKFIKTQFTFFSCFLFLNSLQLPTSLSFRIGIGGRIDMHNTVCSIAQNTVRSDCSCTERERKTHQNPCEQSKRPSSRLQPNPAHWYSMRFSSKQKKK